MVPTEIQFHVFLTDFALHSENKFFPSSVVEFYAFYTQTLNSASLNLPSFRLHNPSSSQYFLSVVVFSAPRCSALAFLCTSPEGTCLNQHSVSRGDLPSAEQSPRITACFLWAVGNLGWVLTWLFHFQFQNYLIGLDISGCCHVAEKAKSLQCFGNLSIDLNGEGIWDLSYPNLMTSILN